MVQFLEVIRRNSIPYSTLMTFSGPQQHIISPSFPSSLLSWNPEESVSNGSLLSSQLPHGNLSKLQSDSTIFLHKIFDELPVALERKSSHLLALPDITWPSHLFSFCFLSHGHCPTRHLLCCLGDSKPSLYSHGLLPRKAFHWCSRQGGAVSLGSHCPCYIPRAQDLSQGIVIILLPVCHSQETGILLSPLHHCNLALSPVSQ